MLRVTVRFFMVYMQVITILQKPVVTVRYNANKADRNANYIS